jgi:SAM-dependent methyltransferase
MERRTIEHLASLHRALYRDHAEDFARTRQRPWVGWTRLLDTLARRAPLPDHPSVLDAGCGNGRFARFLAEHLGRPFDYVGVDESLPLLEHARAAAPADARLVEGELIFESIETILARAGHPGPFHLVAAMGVFHHVPSAERRQALIRSLAGVLAPGGCLAISFWEVEQADAFRRRVLWSDYLARAGQPFSERDLEPGDHLLLFGPDALRYAHHTSDDERAALCAASGLERLDEYESDANNRYFLLVRPS